MGMRLKCWRSTEFNLNYNINATFHFPLPQSVHLFDSFCSLLKTSREITISEVSAIIGTSVRFFICVKFSWHSKITTMYNPNKQNSCVAERYRTRRVYSDYPDLDGLNYLDLLGSLKLSRVRPG